MSALSLCYCRTWPGFPGHVLHPEGGAAGPRLYRAIFGDFAWPPINPFDTSVCPKVWMLKGLCMRVLSRFWERRHIWQSLYDPNWIIVTQHWARYRNPFEASLAANARLNTWERMVETVIALKVVIDLEIGLIGSNPTADQFHQLNDSIRRVDHLTNQAVSELQTREAFEQQGAQIQNPVSGIVPAFHTAPPPAFHGAPMPATMAAPQSANTAAPMPAPVPAPPPAPRPAHMTIPTAAHTAAPTAAPSPAPTPAPKIEDQGVDSMTAAEISESSEREVKEESPMSEESSVSEEE